MEYRVTREGAVPVLYCRRQERWLPVERHMDCEFCAAVVFDEDDDPVSFLCTHDAERREFQPNFDDSHIEIGRGGPDAPEPEEE